MKCDGIQCRVCSTRMNAVVSIQRSIKQAVNYERKTYPVQICFKYLEFKQLSQADALVAMVDRQLSAKPPRVFISLVRPASVNAIRRPRDPPKAENQTRKSLPHHRKVLIDLNIHWAPYIIRDREK